jgi:outer membrane protein assembly factor BamA
LAERTPLSLNYRYELTGIDASDVYFCVNFGVCDAPTLQSFSKYQRLSPLAVSLSRDRTDDPFEPHRGTRGEVDAEIADWWTASDFRYGRISAEGAGFLPMGRRSTLAVHLKGGYVQAFHGTAEALGVSDSLGDALLHPRKRFYSGGSQSVRGFGESQLGPRVLTISEAALRADTIGCPASLAIQDCHPNGGLLKDQDFEPRPLGGNILAEFSVEYRYRILPELIGAVFIDGGYLAQRTDKALPGSQSAVTPGFGVRYQSPVGPIRVDVGINPVTTQNLPVVTEDSTTHQLIQLHETRTYSPAHGGWSEILSRLTLHLSIGEAF